MMRKPIHLLILLLVALLVGSPGHARAEQRWPWSNDRDTENGPQNVAGDFDYYALVLSWSPTYCADEGEDDDRQCNRTDGRRYSFVLHGLWPQYERGYPSNCRLYRRPFVPQPIIERMLDIMPSPRLVIHEYRTHGTCSGLDPDKYFSTARRLFDGIKIPSRFQNPFEPQFVSLEDIRNDFLRANPALGNDEMTVVCAGTGRRLKEIRFCFAKDGKPRPCGENENQRNLCSATQVFVPPTRSTAREDRTTAPQRPSINWNDNSPLPGPRPDFGRTNP